MVGQIQRGVRAYAPFCNSSNVFDHEKHSTQNAGTEAITECKLTAFQLQHSLLASPTRGALLKSQSSLKFISMKFVYLTIASALLFSGCAHEGRSAEDGEPMQLETDPQGAATAQTQEQTADQTTVRDEPAPDPKTVGAAKNSLPDSSYFNTDEKNAVATTEANEDDSAAPEEEPAPHVPAVQPMAHKGIHNTEKTLKKSVKFKSQKKSTALLTLVEQAKDIKVTFTATKVKAGKYMIFFEKGCKKSTKGKPVKVAQFIVKKGDKFSGKASTRVFTLKNGTAKSVKGKALVLYFGPRANTRLSCELVK